MALAAWTVSGAEPTKLSSSSVGLEKHLEDWINTDPSLVDRGLVVLRRQLNLGAAGRLDLLCVDQQGRLVIVEIKRGTLIRETIAQGIDYASVIASWSSEQIRSHVDESVRVAHSDHPGVGALLASGDDDEPREVEIVIVGCGADEGVDRMIEFLRTKHSVPIRAVTFDVFALADGQRILVREEREPDTPTQEPKAAWSVDAVVAKAGGAESPGGKQMLAIVEAGRRNDLYIRPYKWSIMLTPQQKRTRYLATVWRLSKTQIVLTYSADAFAEFFPVTAERVTEALGPDRVEFAGIEDAFAWGRRLDELFASMSTEAEEARGGTEEAQAS